MRRRCSQCDSLQLSGPGQAIEPQRPSIPWRQSLVTKVTKNPGTLELTLCKATIMRYVLCGLYIPIYQMTCQQAAAEQQPALEPQSAGAPLSPRFSNATHEPLPSVGSGVRRHVSLTYGAAAAGSRKGGLKRSGTLQAPSHSQNTTPPEPVEQEQEEEYNYGTEEAGNYEDDYFPRQQYPASPPVGRASPWTPSNEWRSSGYPSAGTSIDDVQRALSTLELSNNQNMGHNYHPGGQSVHPGGQSVHPPRFNPPYPPPLHVMGSRHVNNGSNSSGNGKNPLMTEYDGQQAQAPLSQGRSSYMHSTNERGSWEQRERVLSNRSSNSSLQYGYQQMASQHGKSGSSGSGSGSQGQYMPQPRLNVPSPFGGQQQSSPGQVAAPGFLSAPIDVPSLIATKGYNPIDFDTKPAFVGFIYFASQSPLTTYLRHGTL